MAFFSKAGNILRLSVKKHANHEMSASNPSIFQMIRCMSSSKLFIGGLSYNTDDMSLGEAFNKYGEVVEARVIVDRETGRSRGFGFITFTDPEAASAAIQALDGQELHGRRVRVNHANDRARGPGFGGGGYGQQGGGGGYGTGGYENTNSYDNQNVGGTDANSGDFGYPSYGQQGGGGGYGTSGYANTNSYDSQNVGGTGANSGDFGGNNVGTGGSDGFGNASNYATGGSSGSSDGFGFGSDNQSFNNTGSGSSFTDDANTGYSQDSPLQGNHRDDDDEPNDYANRRA